MAQIGKTIQLYLMDGDALGRWQASLSNWNGLCYKIPRTLLKQGDCIDELNLPGVYFLFGVDNESGRPFVYVGEGDHVAKRIMQLHPFEKDGNYWTEAVIYVTPDETLDKARIKYLESRFHAIAVECERYIVKNGNNPPQSSVHRMVKDLLEEFILNAKLVMLALGYKVLEPLPSLNAKKTKEGLLYCSRNNGRGGSGIGKLADDGFWLLKGSIINPDVADYLPSGIKKKRKLYASSIDKNNRLIKDLCFGSPSYASAFVFGKNSNGLDEWKDADGRTLKELSGEIGIEKSKKSKINRSAVQSEESYLEFHLAGKQVAAKACVVEDGFLVKRGSGFSGKESKSCARGIRNKRRSLIEKGVIVNGRFVRDEKFASPSMAAACILGRNTNGRNAWLDKDGKTLKEIQETSGNL